MTYLVITLLVNLLCAGDRFRCPKSCRELCHRLPTQKDHPPFYKHFELGIAKQLLKDSWPLIFSAIVVMIYMRIDQIIIKEMLGEYEVGIYSAAVRLSEGCYFIPMLITASLFPAILNGKKQSEELYKQRLQHLYTLMVWMAIGRHCQ